MRTRVGPPKLVWVGIGATPVGLLLVSLMGLGSFAPFLVVASVLGGLLFGVWKLIDQVARPSGPQRGVAITQPVSVRRSPPSQDDTPTLTPQPEPGAHEPATEVRARSVDDLTTTSARHGPREKRRLALLDSRGKLVGIGIVALLATTLGFLLARNTGSSTREPAMALAATSNDIVGQLDELVRAAGLWTRGVRIYEEDLYVEELGLTLRAAVDDLSLNSATSTTDGLLAVWACLPTSNSADWNNRECSQLMTP